MLVAAGASTRMGFPKLWVDICGQPLLARVIAAAQAANPSELIVVVSEDRLAHATAVMAQPLIKVPPVAVHRIVSKQVGDSFEIRVLLPPMIPGEQTRFPVVYMTGAAADEWASQGVPNSILLQKPFAPAQLVTAVSQLLNTGSPMT